MQVVWATVKMCLQVLGLSAGITEIEVVLFTIFRLFAITFWRTHGTRLSGRSAKFVNSALGLQRPVPRNPEAGNSARSIFPAKPGTRSGPHPDDLVSSYKNEVNPSRD